ncbi:hypothetical protein [Nonomuraea wenchangensis]|uniref:Uncharacterized protein n=1 Tax=Nonomuraea wenchangensis TaxID=568860 RepID=A0A1I0FK29_9ACTN|nr:hypothetical protein [Nonomuraea wenchangensis]SET58433.1 hypothetical protein SAMN05421811_103499 [Nonomuraea wenchangensis]
MKPAALPGDRDMRVWDVLCAGTTLGVLAWGAVGAWTAATVETYPWNAWIPFPVGAAKGAVLGLLAAAAVLAVLPKGPRLGRSGPAFCAAFAGGASALAPEIRGNGGHANEGPLAILFCWSVGLPVLFAGLVRWGLLLGRRAGGGRPAEPAAAIRPVVRP